MTDIEDFNLDEELALLEAQGASAQKYFMHSNAHQMAFTKYVTSAKQAKESGNAVLAKKLNSMGKKHKAAAEALGALAGHHIDHEFSRQLRIKQAAQANPPMKEELEVTDQLDELTGKGKLEGIRRQHVKDASQSMHDRDEAEERGDDDEAEQHYDDYHRSTYNAERAADLQRRHANKEVRKTVKQRMTQEDLDFDIEDLEIDSPESLEEAFKANPGNNGYEGRRSKAQEICGRHISKILGPTKSTVQHIDKGGLVIQSHLHGKQGNSKHVREMSKTLDAHGIPHRYEDMSSNWSGRHKDHLYVLSADAHNHGARIHLAKQQDKIHKKAVDFEADRNRLIQHNEEYQMDEELEVIETNPIQELIALAINKKPVDFSDKVQDIIRSIAGEKLAQIQEDLARSIGGTEEEIEDDAEELDEISVPPTGKAVDSNPGADVSDPSTKTPPTITATGSKKHLVKSNAKTPEQKSVSKAAGDTFRSQEAAK